MPPTSSDDLLLRAAPGGVHVAVRLTPRAGADRLGGLIRLADGSVALKAAVSAPPADGRANEALLQLLAGQWGVPRRDLAIVAGHHSRNKSVRIAGPPAILMARLAAALAALAQR